MLVDKGYKQSEVGKIPIDWEVKRFTDCANLKHGFQFREEHFSQTGVKIIKIGNLKYSGELDLEKITFVPSEQLSKFSNFLLNRGDILMALTGATLGKTSIVNTDELLLQNYRVGNFYNNPKYSKNYIYYLLQSKFIQKTINKLVNEAAQPNLGKGDFDKFIVPIPPTITEQNEITTVLINADSLISNLKKLIDKKRKIKQGAMQQLLKPKMGWEENKLGDIVIYKNGKAHENCVVDNGEYIIVNSKFISTDGNIAKYSNSQLCPVSKDEILMVLSDIPNGKAIAKCFLVEKDNKYTLNQRICSLKSINTDPKFLFYLLNRNPYFLSFDDGAKQTNLRNIDVLNCPLTIPSNIEEQIIISNILSDMDSEISLLEEKLTKAQLIKQGMMQNLLTGKIRLVCQK